jgi:hypothetical protein
MPGKKSRECTYRSPGVFGLDTLITNTSAYGPNVRTPDTKSPIESRGDDLFLPRLTARREPGRSEAGMSWDSGVKAGTRARIRANTAAWPSEGKP